jgi:Mpv17 / PMP22 family
MILGVRIRERWTSSEGSIWSQVSFLFRLVLLVGMLPMIFPESEAQLLTNLSILQHSNAYCYYYYMNTVSSVSVSVSSSASSLPSLYYTTAVTSSQQTRQQTQIQTQPWRELRKNGLWRPLQSCRSMAQLVESVHTLGRRRAAIYTNDHCRYPSGSGSGSWYFFLEDPIVRMLSWIVVVCSAWCLWCRCYRWRYTLSVLLLMAHYVSSSSSSSSSSSEGIFHHMATLAQPIGLWYMTKLQNHPILTKSISSGVIGAIADYVAQWLEHIIHVRQHASARNQNRFFVDQDEWWWWWCWWYAKTTRTGCVLVPKESSLRFYSLSIYGRYHIRRGISILADGLFVSGPLMHLAYEFFESVLPIGDGTTGWIAAIVHVLADSIVLDSFFVASRFFTTGLMEGIPIRQLIPQFQSAYLPSLKASWATSLLMGPIQFSCFRYLPLSFRVLSVNIMDVIWDAVISFVTHRSR